MRMLTVLIFLLFSNSSFIYKVSGISFAHIFIIWVMFNNYDHFYPDLSTDFEWFALYVRSKHEFVVQKELLEKRIDTFLPTVQKYSQWKDRKKFINFPLFPSYLFVHINPQPEKFINLLRTRGVVKLVSSGQGSPTPVPAQEISSLQILLENKSDFDIYPYFKNGVRIWVRKGPLKGIEGVLKLKENQYMCIINIEILGRSVGVKIYSDDLEVL
jgi:transcriptional antiterminator NusG